MAELLVALENVELGQPSFVFLGLLAGAFVVMLELGCGEWLWDFRLLFFFFIIILRGRGF